MDYKPKFDYKLVTSNIPGYTPKAVLDLFLDELHQAQLDMIDQAVECSDLQDAKDIIEYIKNK